MYAPFELPLCNYKYLMISDDAMFGYSNTLATDLSLYCDYKDYVDKNFNGDVYIVKCYNKRNMNKGKEYSLTKFDINTLKRLINYENNRDTK